MSSCDGVSVGKGKSEIQPDSYLHGLAMLPISFLSEQGNRLSGLCDQTAVGDNYRNLFASSVWVYTLHAYLGLVREQMGAGVASTVWLRQRDMLDEVDAGSGESMESAFKLIDAALDMNRIHSDELETNIRILPETRVALALLMGMPESPDYASCIYDRSNRIRTMQAEVESYLAHCISHARKELLAACSVLFSLSGGFGHGK